MGLQDVNTDFILIDESSTVKQATSLMLKKQARVIIMMKDKRPIGLCDSYDLLMQSETPSKLVDYRTDFRVVDQSRVLSHGDLQAPYLIVKNEAGEIVGWLDAGSAELQYIKQTFSQELRDLATDLEAIVDSIYDEVLVVDGQGTVLRVSNRSHLNLWGVNLSSVVGKNMLDLEEKGWFKPSVTRRVLTEKKKISIVQQNRFGRKILAVGNPIFNRKKEIERIVIASRDITEVTNLKEELEEARSLNEKYRQEMNILRKVQHENEKPIIYKSERMEELLFEMEKVARVSSTVTIYGESGVGKELIAHAIHHLSPRKEKPFIKINCGSIPENLLESELFGYEKGAFTGALHQGKKGLFEIADEGTLFLDEVGELPLNLQVKLLRAIQEREVMKIGGTHPVRVDVRIITATNRDLEDMVAKGTFREDLYYRLHVIPLFVPALRERIEDIEPLVHHFLDYFNEKFATKMHFSEDALELLKAYHWPGNVRQLQNVLERVMVVSSSHLIMANDLSRILGGSHVPDGSGAGSARRKPPVQVNAIIPMEKAVELTEYQLIKMALAEYKTLTRAAKALEISQPTMSRHFNRLSEKMNFE
ncbi:sigma-54-dependent Fis family transcriptional regulator [Ammoniphilus sp. CFH 90114]|uniref:sigma-54 interaction domain-containing protein n=1 Tax=Ammoniphilus sp. CFH 90114 TaxID=2493665 RepID=UPI00100DAB52|nr:sigma 54-interacting transcriptional regulator [Ammoniphilus sp. CFH 90114]RXT07266.1 AAA family ATPase [Ammoniphilus sp. CFH 90114]